MENEDAAATRRVMLKKWIDEKFNGSQASYLDDIAKRDTEKPLNQGELSALLKDKSFGEKKARKLEMQSNMPTRYLEGEEISSQIAHLIKMRKEHPEIADYAIEEAIKEINSIIEFQNKPKNSSTQ